MNKTISTTIGILIIVFVAGVAGASVLFFNQRKETIIGYDIVLEENNFIDNNEENISEMKESGQEIKTLTSDWVGVYEYVEFEPGAAASPQIYQYNLEIYKEENELKARLFIDGHMMMGDIQAIAEEEEGDLNILFDSYLSEYSSSVCRESVDSYVRCKKGDLLFILKRASNNEYRILWGKIGSAVVDPGDASFKKITEEELIDSFLLRIRERNSIQN
jgi:hypothetical protein